MLLVTSRVDGGGHVSVLCRTLDAGSVVASRPLAPRREQCGAGLGLWLFLASHVAFLFASSGRHYQQPKHGRWVHMGRSVPSSAGRNCRGRGARCAAGVGVSTQMKLSEAVVSSAGSCRVSSAENHVSASERRNDLCAGQFPPFVFGR